MSETVKHTPGPWKAVWDHRWDSGITYISVQPVTPDPDTMRPLLMASGEYHVCRMTHTAAMHRLNLHMANAEFIVKAVNCHDEVLEALKACRRELSYCKDQLAHHGYESREGGSVLEALRIGGAAIAKATGGSNA